MEPPHPVRPLLFLDYDGTLAPLVEDPAAASPHPAVPALLRQLGVRHPLYVVTGRDLATLARLLSVHVPAVGLHGGEEGLLGGEVRRLETGDHAAALGRLKAAVPRLPGVHVEEKGGAFAVHYRRATDGQAARDALARWVDAVPEGLEPIWGKHVVELRAQGVSKGVAVARIAAQHPDRTPVYLGDDVTDEEAFRALDAAHPEAVTVKVGAGETAGRYRLADVPAVVGYLRGFAGS